jgi:CDP-diglyceride synthetase
VAVMVAGAGAVVAVDLVWRLPLLACVVSILAALCICEIASFWRRRMTTKLLLAMVLQIVITVAAVATIWIVELSDPQWWWIVVAVVLPVLIQNTLAYYVGRFLIPRLQSDHDPFVQFLAWQHFHYSPKKTLGVTIFTVVITLALMLPWVWYDPLMLSLTVLSAIGAPVGDWVASHLKRQAKVADSGERLRRGPLAWFELVIRSHGGYLDRFDALFFCAALALVPILVFWWV